MASILHAAPRPKLIVTLGVCILAACCFSLRAVENSSALEPAKMVTAYALTSASNTEGQDPANWRLVASNDGGTSWVLLDVETNQVFTARSQRRVFHIPNRMAYPAYRLIVNTISEMRLGEFELIGPAVNIPQEAGLEVVRTSSGLHSVLVPNTFDDPAARWMDTLTGGHCCWIQCQYTSRTRAAASGVNLAGYALTSADDEPARDPCDWRLLGSNNGGETWSMLDERHNETFTNRIERREFSMATPAKYETYRLQIDSVRLPAKEPGGGDSVQLAEIEPLYGPTNDEGELSLVISARGENPPLETAEAAFDRLTNTKWLDFSGKQDREHNSSWIQWRYQRRGKEQSSPDLGWFQGGFMPAGPARIVTAYALTSASSMVRPDPADWELAASNDGGVSWAVLDTQTHQQFNARSQRRVYSIPNRKAYSSYRLTVKNLSSVALAELEFVGPAVNVSPDSSLEEVITSSGEHPVLGPAKQAFDRDLATKWLGLSTGNNSCWIQCQYVSHAENVATNLNQILILVQRQAANPVFDNELDILSKLHAKASHPRRKVIGYALTSANDIPDRDPRDWRLLGLNDDGITWDTLDERHDESFSRRFLRRQFTVANPGTYCAYRLQIDSVRLPANEPGGSDSVQLSEFEPLYGPGGDDSALSLVVSAEGENPPRETIDTVFDGDLESKWLDFIAGPGKTNRTTWIEWRYIPRVKQHIINLRWLQGVSPQAAEPTRLSLEGIVLSWRPEDSLLGLLDDSGFQTLKLEGEGFDPNPGERIHLGGQLKFEQGRGVVKEAELTNLGLIASIDERHLDALSASGPKFAFGSITGIVTFISANQTSFRTENGGRFLVKIPNPGHLQNNILVPGCRYRVEGIIQSILNQYVEMAAGVVWVPDMDHVTPEIVSESDWGKWPKYSLATLLETVIAPPLLVRVNGTVTAQCLGREVTINDGTNQISVYSRQTNVFASNSTVEALGFLDKSIGQPALRLAQVRLAPDQTTEATTNGTSGSVTELRKIRELARTYPTNDVPVKIHGVITYIDMDLDHFYIQDGADAIEVGDELDAGLFPFLLQEGNYVEFNGACNENGVHATGAARVLARGQMPEPRRRLWSTLMTGADADRWIEVEGLVSTVENQRFTLSVPGGKMTVWINTFEAELRDRLLGSTVRVRGVCAPLRNPHNQILGLRLLVPGDECIEIVEAAPGNLFDLPTTPIGAVMGEDASQTGLERMVKTSGVVTYKDQLLLFVQDGKDALRVLLRKDVDVGPGDRVEVAGLPEPDGFSPKLIQAQARKTGLGSFPPPNTIDLIGNNSSNEGNQCDATRCQIVATYLGHSPEGAEPLLNLQDEDTRQMFIAYLPNNTPPFDLPPPGSRVRLQGVFKEKMDAVLDYDQAASEFEMYLSSPDDMTVLQRPSWWSIRHTFWVLGGLGVVLLFSMIWVRLLRKQVRQRTQELSAEIEQRKRVEAQVEKAHKELVLISRQAGMAEVATTVLHNVGNVLNSVNVSASVVTDQVNRSHAGKVARVADLMREHTADLGQFLTTDPRGQHMPDYVARLGEHLAKEQKDILAELNSLNNNINHIKEIVATQQSYAKVMCVTESVKVTDLIEDVLRMNEGLWARHAVRLTREFDRDLTLIIVDKHQVMQIITNLLRNAKHACDDSGRADKQITIRARHDGQRVKISVTDNGIGILPENLPSIFNQGFTTRKDGHGFGLHSGALAAKNLGGALTVQSDGMNLGATFTLVLKQANWESERP